jgi:protein ImuB
MVVSCPELHRADSRAADSRADLRAGSRANPGASLRAGPGADTGANPGSETARRHERMVTIVTGFCPDVEIVESGVCAFGARGPARYFGGEMALATRIIAALANPGIQENPGIQAEPATQANPGIQAGPRVRVGVADGLFAALLAARSQQHGTPELQDQVTMVPPGGTTRFLAPQPVSVLADQDLARLLGRLGLGTLGDFAALPARDVASRFGDPGECAHRLARGLDPRPLATSPPPADLSVTQEFDPPEPRAEPVVFAAKALAGRLHDGLAARGLTCVRVQVTATWADGQESSRRWRHDGLLSAAAVAERVRWQLDGRQLDGWQHNPETSQETPGGIAALRLDPDQVVRAAGQQLTLWGEATISDRVARAALRVQALLGHEAVLRPLLGGGRNADDQVTPVPFGEKRDPERASGQPWPGRVMGPAPGLVFPAAREAEVTDDAGNLVTVSGRCALSGVPARLTMQNEPPRRVTGWAGPWPLSERWWDPPAARRRARFQLATDDGRAWLAVVEGGRWLVEAGYW